MKFFDKHKIRYLSSKIEPESFINYSGGYCARRTKMCVNALSFWLISGNRKMWEFILNRDPL